MCKSLLSGLVSSVCREEGQHCEFTVCRRAKRRATDDCISRNDSHTVSGVPTVTAEHADR